MRIRDRLIFAFVALASTIGAVVHADNSADWPRYNRTLTSERFSPLKSIDTWISSVDAVTGRQRWRFKSPNPIIGGVTPTAGVIVLFGDMGGNFFALDSATETKLGQWDLGGAISGGVITYDTGAGQKVAVITGMTSKIWPTPKVMAKVVVLAAE